MPRRAGEALLLTGLAVTLGVVWYGGYVRVPRYLLPLIPLLALVLARAAQLTWRWTRAGTVVWVSAYLLAVGMDLAPDITAFWPEARIRYRQEREADARLFASLRANDLRKAYAFDYWLAPRLTFEAGGEIIVAQPFNDRYPPHTLAVDRSPRPAYVVQAGVETFRAWLAATRVTSREDVAGEFHVFHDFTPPPDVRPLARSAFTVRTSAGRGEAASVVDAKLDTGWSSVKGPDGSAWIEVDLDAERPVSGVTLVNDRAERVPDHLVVMAERAGSGLDVVASLAPQGVAAHWENGAIRITASRTLTVRFAPVTTRRLRLVEKGPPGRWSVAELFLLGPAPPGAPPDAADALVQRGPPPRGGGTDGAGAPALPRGDASGSGRSGRVRGRRAADHPAPGERPVPVRLRRAARGPRAPHRRPEPPTPTPTRALGPERVHVELWRIRARLAAGGWRCRRGIPARRRGGRGARAGPAGRRAHGRPGRARGLRRPAGAAPGRRARWSSPPTGASTGRPGDV